MKASNLIGLLAIGGIGYYLLKNKNKPSIIPDFSEQISENETPITTTPINTTPITASLTPISTAKETIPSEGCYKATPDSKCVSIETALKSLGLQNAVESKSPIVDKVSDAIYQSNKDCEVPNEGWESIDVNRFINNNGDIRALILDLNLKEKGIHYRDLCGNIVQKQTAPLPTNNGSKILPNGFMKRGIGLSDIKLAPIYYVKNQRAIVLPYKMVNEYRQKYIVPLEKYLKNLPKLDPSKGAWYMSLINPDTKQPYPLNEHGELMNNYPTDGVWKHPPYGLNGGGVNSLQELEDIITNNKNSDITKLVLNPRIRNSNNLYIDQFGNMVRTPYIFKWGNGTATVWHTNNIIAEYRVKNNIPF